MQFLVKKNDFFLDRETTSRKNYFLIILGMVQETENNMWYPPMHMRSEW